MTFTEDQINSRLLTPYMVPGPLDNDDEIPTPPLGEAQFDDALAVDDAAIEEDIDADLVEEIDEEPEEIFDEATNPNARVPDVTDANPPPSVPALPLAAAAEIEFSPTQWIEAARAQASSIAAGSEVARRVLFYRQEIDAHLDSNTPREDLQAIYYHEIGHLLEQAGEEGQAVREYAKALQLDASLRPNLWAVRRLFERRGLWTNLVKVLDAEIRIAVDDRTRALIWLEKGTIYETRLQDREGAASCYRKTTELAPELLSAWMGLERVSDVNLEQERLKILAGLAAATVDPIRRSVALVELGIGEERLGREEAWNRFAEALTLTAGEQESLARRIEWEAERASRFAMLGLLYERTPGSVEGPVEAGDEMGFDRDFYRLHRYAFLLRQYLSDKERSWQLVKQARVKWPNNRLVEEDLLQTALVTARWDTVAQIYQMRADRTSTASERAEWLLEAAAALRSGEKAEEAEAIERLVYDESEQAFDISARWERQALKNSDWERLVELYRTEADWLQTAGDDTAANPLAAAKLLAKAGYIFDAKLNRFSEAETLYRRALELGGRRSDWIYALDQLLGRQASPQLRVDFLREQFDQALTEKVAADAQFLLGRLLATVVRDDDKVDLLEKYTSSYADDVATKLELLEFYRKLSRWSEFSLLVDDLLTKAEPELQRELLLFRAIIWDLRAGRKAEALEQYRKILHDEPDNVRVSAYLELAVKDRSSQNLQTGDASSQLADLLQLLQEEVAVQKPSEAVGWKWVQIGWLEELMGVREAAPSDAYRHALRMAESATLQRCALRSLVRLGELTHLPDTAELAERLLPLTQSPSANEFLRYIAADAQERAGESETALDQFRRLTSESSGLAAPLGWLRCATRLQDSTQILAAEQALLQACANSDPELSLSFEWESTAAKVVQALQAQSHQPLGGLSDWHTQKARLNQPDLPRSLAVSFALYHFFAAALRSDRPQMVLVVEFLADQLLSTSARIGLYLHAAMLAADSSGERSGETLRLLRKAHSVDPSDSLVVRLLAEWDDDAGVFLRRAALARSVEEEVYWRTLGAERYAAAGDRKSAMEETYRILERDPECFAALVLGYTLSVSGNDDPTRAYFAERLADTVAEIEEKVLLQKEAAEAYQKAGQARDAARLYRDILDAHSDDVEAFASAEALLEPLAAEEAKEALCELYSFRLTVVSDGSQDAYVVLAKRARLYKASAAWGQAELDYRTLYEAGDPTGEALFELAELLVRLPGRRDEAVGLLEELERRSRDSQIVTWTKRTLATYWADDRKDLERACSYLDQLVQMADVDPEEKLADLQKLAGYLIRLRHWQRALQALNRIVETSGKRDEQVQAEVQIARLYADGFADPHAAAGLLQRVLEREPGNFAALETLQQLARGGAITAVDFAHCAARAVDWWHVNHPEKSSVRARILSWHESGDVRKMAAQALWIAHLTPDQSPVAPAGVGTLRSLAPESWTKLFATVRDNPWWEFWHLIREVVTAPSQAGGDRAIAKKDWASSWSTVAQLFLLLGEPERLMVGSQPDQCEWAQAQLICGETFAGGRLTQGRLTQVAWQLALHHEKLDQLVAMSQSDWLAWCIAGFKSIDRQPPAILGAPAKNVTVFTDRLSQNLSRKNRRNMERLCDRLSAATHPELWRQQCKAAAAQLAVLVTGDLADAYQAIVEERIDVADTVLMDFVLSSDYERLLALQLRRGA